MINTAALNQLSQILGVNTQLGFNNNLHQSSQPVRTKSEVELQLENVKKRMREELCELSKLFRDDNERQAFAAKDPEFIQILSREEDTYGFIQRPNKKAKINEPATVVTPIRKPTLPQLTDEQVILEAHLLYQKQALLIQLLQSQTPQQQQQPQQQKQPISRPVERKEKNQCQRDNKRYSRNSSYSSSVARNIVSCK